MTPSSATISDELEKVWAQLSTDFQDRAVLILVQMAINCMTSSTSTLNLETSDEILAERNKGTVNHGPRIGQGHPRS